MPSSHLQPDNPTQQAAAYETSPAFNQITVATPAFQSITARSFVNIPFLNSSTTIVCDTKILRDLPPSHTKSASMASLNLSTNGPSITKSYQAVVSAAPATAGPAASPTFAQWALFGVSTPLVNAFQPDAGNKESVLKVQSSDGRCPRNE